jgi:RNA ligase
MFFLPSYEFCKDICEKTNKQLFYESNFNIDGYDISIFNYRIPTYQDFLQYQAFELRGLTFVFNKDGSVFKRFLLMEKFFNLNENESTFIDLVKNKKIKSVFSKEDGSIINFIQLPNGRILAKSKMSFESEQALYVQSLLDSNTDLYEFVKDCIDKDISPVFEYVGPNNRVVVKYDKSDLILLRVRNNSTGEYLNLDDFDFKKPSKFRFSLGDLISLKSELVGIEGWIVEFNDSQKIKIKTDWYISLHRILTDYSNREDYLIDMILDEKIDDILSVLDQGSESRIFVEKVIVTTNLRLSEISQKVDYLVNQFNGDKKQFALSYKDDPYFYKAIRIIMGQDKFELIKEFVKKKTYRLHEARFWLWQDR